MPDHTSIYKNEAQQYHQLIAKQQDLTQHIEEIRSVRGLDVVDIGSGSGRFTADLAPLANTVIAVDSSEAMLQVNADRLKRAGLTNWTTLAADYRHLPLADRSADLIVAGWTICYLSNTNVLNWQQNLEDVMTELRRILRPNGSIIILETMGTGAETPDPPSFLTAYYSALEQQYGFSHKWIRTDYAFDDIEQAEALTRFFFGDELADRVVLQNLVHLPECAGIWWLHL